MERIRALLIAPPGAGKGTQADRLSAHYEVRHVSTGDVFRQEVAAGTELGRKVAGFLQRGDLVPDALVGEVVWREVAAAVEETGGYLLDGFPRTREQAEAAYRVAQDLGLLAEAVITYDVPHEVLLARLLERAMTEGRTDDTEATIRHRIAVYEADTAPVLAFYAERRILVRVDADHPVEAVTAATIAAVDAVRARRGR